MQAGIERAEGGTGVSRWSIVPAQLADLSNQVPSNVMIANLGKEHNFLLTPVRNQFFAEFRQLQLDSRKLRAGVAVPAHNFSCKFIQARYFAGLRRRDGFPQYAWPLQLSDPGIAGVPLKPKEPASCLRLQQSNLDTLTINDRYERLRTDDIRIISRVRRVA